jgi:hypothetical protein
MPGGVNSCNGLIFNGFRKETRFHQDEIYGTFWPSYAVDFQLRAASGKEIERSLSQEIILAIQSISVRSVVKAAIWPAWHFELGWSLMPKTLLGCPE